MAHMATAIATAAATSQVLLAIDGSAANLRCLCLGVGRSTGRRMFIIQGSVVHWTYLLQ